jgi:6-pyruvoyltetrahydropterin/6-carboxytetrahydropterin synthase
MYELFVEEHFDAAHRLRNYQGKCETLHGHRYKVVVRVQADKLDKSGMAYDFSQLKRYLRGVLSRFDHAYLNEAPPFDKIEPSCENLAATIHSELQLHFSESPVKLACVEVWESPTSGVAYCP